MTSDSEVGESGTEPTPGEQGTGPGPVTKPGSSIVLYVIAGVPILIVFVLAVVFRSIPVLMVLVPGGILGGTVGAVRSRIRNQQASPSTRAQSTAAGATVGLLAAVGLTGVGFVVGAIGLVVILMMALRTRDCGGFVPSVGPAVASRLVTRRTSPTPSSWPSLATQ